MNNEKNNRAVRAQLHVDLMEKTYKEQTERSITNTVYLSEENAPDICFSVDLVDTDAVGAVMTYAQPGVRVSLLNFASSLYPGGGFINGAIAQEEAICHESNLYNILASESCNIHYQKNRKDAEMSKELAYLYPNRAMYTPSVVFVRDGVEKEANVLTCAAPNKSAYIASGGSSFVNDRHLEKRIRFVMESFSKYPTDVLILGAYGCGAFGQDPELVAELFKQYLPVLNGSVKKVVFAVPKNTKNRNYNAFRKTFDPGAVMQRNTFLESFF